MTLIMLQITRKITTVMTACTLLALPQMGCQTKVKEPSHLTVEREMTVKEAASLGQSEADENHKAGNECIYFIGLPQPGPQIDELTGLPLKPIAGCVVTPQIIARMNAHNDRIKKLIQK